MKKKPKTTYPGKVRIEKEKTISEKKKTFSSKSILLNVEEKKEKKILVLCFCFIFVGLIFFPMLTFLFLDGIHSCVKLKEHYLHMYSFLLAYPHTNRKSSGKN